MAGATLRGGAVLAVLGARDRFEHRLVDAFVVPRAYGGAEFLREKQLQTTRRRSPNELVVTAEPTPNDHRLAALKSINPRDIAGETFVAVSDTAPVLRVVIDDYLKRSGINITPDHEADHLAMGMSLIASTRGVGLLPAYAQNFLASSLTSRPLKGDTPTIDLVFGYNKSNKSPILKLLLSRLDELIARASSKAP